MSNTKKTAAETIEAGLRLRIKQLSHQFKQRQPIIAEVTKDEIINDVSSEDKELALWLAKNDLMQVISALDSAISAMQYGEFDAFPIEVWVQQLTKINEEFNSRLVL